MFTIVLVLLNSLYCVYYMYGMCQKNSCTVIRWKYLQFRIYLIKCCKTAGLIECFPFDFYMFLYISQDLLCKRTGFEIEISCRVSNCLKQLKLEEPVWVSEEPNEFNVKWSEDILMRYPCLMPYWGILIEAASLFSNN